MNVAAKKSIKYKKTFKKGLTNVRSCGIIIPVSERDTHWWNGSIAQLGEHLPYKQRVIGSSPIVSIKRG